jgi:hypothetical protein
MKLIYVLIRNGVCALTTPEDYQELVEIYAQSSVLTRTAFDRFHDLIEARLTVINTDILVRLIGDVLADRGQNDWLTLVILQKLHHAGVQVRILMSNHDGWFLDALGLHGEHARNQAIHNMRFNQQGQSFFGLIALLREQWISQKDLNIIIQEIYLPSLLLLDYSLNKRGQLTIFTHAPCDLISIQDVADQLGVLYQGPSVTGLQRTLDEINHEFLVCIRHGLTGHILNAGSAAYALMWMREDTPNACGPSLNQLRNHQVMRGTKGDLIFVYGHDTPSAQATRHVVRLDNDIGKQGLINTYGEKEISYVSNELLIQPSLLAYDFSHDDFSNKKYAKNIQLKLQRNQLNFLNKLSVLESKASHAVDFNKVVQLKHVVENVTEMLAHTHTDFKKPLPLWVEEINALITDGYLIKPTKSVHLRFLAEGRKLNVLLRSLKWQEDKYFPEHDKTALRARRPELAPLFEDKPTYNFENFVYDFMDECSENLALLSPEFKLGFMGVASFLLVATVVSPNLVGLGRLGLFGRQPSDDFIFENKAINARIMGA